MSFSRRSFLTYLGLGTYSLLRGDKAAAQPRFPLTRRKGKPPDFFTPIDPKLKKTDDLTLPPEFRDKLDLVCRWNDDLGTLNPDTKEKQLFGFNADFVAYLPIDALKGGKNNEEGLLWVNHEYPHPLFVSGYKEGAKKTEEQILAEKRCVGGSVFRVKRVNDKWQMTPGAMENRRYSALWPKIGFSGPADMLGEADGTLANCHGGVTPWNTILTCEENFQDYNSTEKRGYRWSDQPKLKIDERKYGWVVEIDPFGEKGMEPRKLTALGRSAHENAEWRLGKSGRLAIYMGDDAQDQFLYKFVSHEKLDITKPRTEQRKLLDKGTLYAADFINGKWLPLDLERNEKLREAGFLTQGEVVLRAREAGKAAGATPLDRPEDCILHPRDQSLYVAMTNNEKHANLHGHIVRLLEDKDDAEAESFRFEIFLVGGPQSGLSCPDNMTFDKQCNLWVFCDMSSNKIGKGPFESFGNNGIYVVPTIGDSTGDAFQFASGPVQCEMTGPWFSPNADTLFFSVQHPGEETTDLNNPSSCWPGKKGDLPRPSVVAVRGFTWK